ncbi:MAG: glutathione S-transferase family protein [Sphingomonadales bacterium]|nr:glutathione S-transferase family protein [Sphingomonadales bacterium]MBD3773538.1 glutathione S-transferase family protein [Paracoccaceae bacterium]
MGAILYHGQPNGPSFSVLAALAESGLAIETRSIDLLAGERHTIPGLAEPLARDMGLEGEGPVLVADGEAMTDAVFLAQYFDEAAGGCGLQPADPYAHWEMMMWCRQLTERLAPAAACLGTLAHAQPALAALGGDAFAALAANIASEDLRARWQDLHDGAFDTAKLADSKAKVAQFAQRTEDRLADGRDWLMGDFSIADFETYGWMAGMRALEPEAFAGKPHLTAWFARIEARPATQAALAHATVADPSAAWAPGPEINRWG